MDIKDGGDTIAAFSNTLIPSKKINIKSIKQIITKKLKL